MAQIALRPVPQAFAVEPTAEGAREVPVRYLLLRRSSKKAIPETAASELAVRWVDTSQDEAKPLEPADAKFVWDFLDLSAPGVGRRLKRMISPAASAEIGLGGGSTADDALGLDADRVMTAPEGAPVLLVRLTLLGARETGSLHATWHAAETNLLGQLDGWVHAAWLPTPLAAGAALAEEQTSEHDFDPFERFDPLEGPILTALAGWTTSASTPTTRHGAISRSTGGMAAAACPRMNCAACSRRTPPSARPSTASI